MKYWQKKRRNIFRLIIIQQWSWKQFWKLQRLYSGGLCTHKSIFSQKRRTKILTKNAIRTTSRKKQNTSAVIYRELEALRKQLDIWNSSKTEKSLPFLEWCFLEKGNKAGKLQQPSKKENSKIMKYTKKAWQLPRLMKYLFLNETLYMQ